MKKRDKKEQLPKYCFARGNQIWYTVKDDHGNWVNKPTGKTLDQVEQARKFVRDIYRVRAAQAETGNPRTLTIRQYGETWLKEREKRKLVSAIDDRCRLEKYVYPYLGDYELDELRPVHVRDLIRKLDSFEGEEKMAPRSILHVYRTLHNMYENAMVEELVLGNPVKVKRGDLPKKVDADPEWRSQATFTVREVERLISDPLIPPGRRVVYALKAIAGLRHGEAVALKWRHIDYTLEPLPKINVVQAFSSRLMEIKSTKSEETRAVPLHPTLAKILAAWKLTHWERIYGRPAKDDDFIVPTLTGNCIAVKDANEAFKRDLDALGLRKAAGKSRDRGGHDLRSWYKTRMIEDEADSLIVRRTTHAPPKDVDGGYERFSWATVCREVSKLRVSILGAGPLEILATPPPKVGKASPFLTASLQGEARARNRWRKVVTPSGLEKDSDGRESSRGSGSLVGKSAKNANPGQRMRTTLVRTSLQMLDRAVRSGDAPRALQIIAQMREIDEQEHPSRTSKPRQDDAPEASSNAASGSGLAVVR